ncbi:TPA: hypothetical protein ACPWGV_006579 [Pseudomonas aeruginosa]
MIDPADKQTQALPLEQPKRGRGRPVTGKALSDAERARRYRANKKKRDAQPSQKEGKDGKEALYRRTVIQQAEQIRTLEQQLVQQREEYNDLVHKLMTERDQLKRDLAAKPKRHRDQPATELPESAYEDEPEAKTWAIQERKGRGRWQTISTGLTRKAGERQFEKLLSGLSDPRYTYRMVEE